MNNRHLVHLADWCLLRLQAVGTVVALFDEGQSVHSEGALLLGPLVGEVTMGLIVHLDRSIQF